MAAEVEGTVEVGTAEVGVVTAVVGTAEEEVEVGTVTGAAEEVEGTATETSAVAEGAEAVGEVTRRNPWGEGLTLRTDLTGSQTNLPSPLPPLPPLPLLKDRATLTFTNRMTAKTKLLPLLLPPPPLLRGEATDRRLGLLPEDPRTQAFELRLERGTATRLLRHLLLRPSLPLPLIS